MNANIQTITLDLTNSAFSAAQKVSVVQGDSGTRPVKAIITDNGVVRTDLSHNSARIYISNVSGEPPTYVEGILIINGVAEFCIPQSATLQPGIKNGELRLVGENEKVLSSMPFMVDVNPSQYDEKALLGTDKGDVLERMIEETSENKSAAEESAEMARKSAEAADDAAKAAAESAAAAQNAATPGVSYSEEQNLTPEQKETARSNINAVDAGLIDTNGGSVSQENIPTYEALRAFTHTREGAAFFPFIVYSTQQQLGVTQKQTARTNIGAISQTELDEAVSNIVKGNETWQIIADITLTEAVKEIIVTQDTEGQAFSLTKAKVIVDTCNQDGFYTATATMSLGILSAETGSHSRSIYLTDYIPNTADRYSRAVFDVEIVDGMAFVSGRCKNNMKTMGFADTGDPATMSGNLACTIKDGIISYLNINTNSANGFSVGTRVQVLGVRA